MTCVLCLVTEAAACRLGATTTVRRETIKNQFERRSLCQTARVVRTRRREEATAEAGGVGTRAGGGRMSRLLTGGTAKTKLGTG